MNSLSRYIDGHQILAWGMSLAAVCAFSSVSTAQQRRVNADWPSPTPAVVKPVSKDDLSSAITSGVGILLRLQEGEPKAQWPYEGVYRVGGAIPIGYRVGGTAICGLALLAAPGYAEDASRQEAIARATRFIIDGTEHELMNPEYKGGYDVRGWGYTYSLLFLLKLQDMRAAPADLAESAHRAAAFYCSAIQKTEIPEVGGWNYARGAIEKPSPPSPFMTGPTLLALYAAKSRGLDVDPAVVERALTYLEKSRTPQGSVNYSGIVERRNDPTPGAVGRMLAAETALLLGGRGSVDRVRGAIDAYITHWPWLDQRRAKTGTHEGPYGVAPYYFYYAHHAAAEAIELLPESERDEYRRRTNELLFATRLESGGWNDRVFARSEGFGTAMAMLSILRPVAPRADAWNTETGKR